MSEAVYVVQVRGEVDRDKTFGDDPDNPTLFWKDVATVTVPARTHRKTVIQKALEQAQEDTDIDVTDALTVRVLDAKSARVTPVETEQPPPRLKIG
jgi:hypothetical protein